MGALLLLKKTCNLHIALVGLLLSHIMSLPDRKRSVEATKAILSLVSLVEKDHRMLGAHH